MLRLYSGILPKARQPGKVKYARENHVKMNLMNTYVFALVDVSLTVRVQTENDGNGAASVGFTAGTVLITSHKI